MADEDEVDILGDFAFDNLFPKEDSRISSCYDGSVLGPQGADQLLHDCINPSWLLESSQHCWLSPTLEERQRSSPATAEERTSPWEEGDTWTEREKSLLEKGIELFGRSWTRVSQFVGTKTPLQVRSHARFMGISCDARVSESSEQEEELIAATSAAASVVTPSLEVEPNCKTPASFNITELYDDMAIPASMEEVIAVVTTAQPTVAESTSSPPLRKKKKFDVPAGGLARPKPQPPKSQIRPPVKKGRPKRIELTETTIELEPVEPPDTALQEVELDFEEAKVNAPIIFVSEGEELIRIQKATDESEDSEIDIDDVDEGEAPKIFKPVEEVKVEQVVKEEEPVKTEIKPEPEEVYEEKIEEYVEADKLCKIEETDKVFEFPTPTKEVFLKPDEIEDQEKEVHFEFFSGRPTKTPSRYLKIRNHIIDLWKECKPNYVSKTQVRSGLKNCGDVNAIGRIHAYLEQIGAINFGCEQALYKAIVIPSNTKKSVSLAAKVKMEPKPLSLRSDFGRPRKKKAEQLDSDGEGGYTITHDEHGSAILTKVYKEQAKPGKSKKGLQNDHHRLVYCHKFSDIHKAPYSVVLDIGALLLMDVHSHASKSEVIGLLGGSYDSKSKKLHISRAVACKSQSTVTQCEMCPVSQTEASETIHYAGLEVVGWYHSHPTFLPNPSLQDIETQVRMQQWFDKTDAPFVGIIVAPYYSGNRTLASNYKCLLMEEEGGETRPYQFPVQVSPSQSYSESLLGRIEDIFMQMDPQTSELVKFDEQTAASSGITYLEKVVESARLHIDNCQPTLSSDQRSALISGIIDLCERNTKPKAELIG